MKNSENTNETRSKLVITTGVAIFVLCIVLTGWHWFAGWRSAALLKKADLELLAHQRYDIAEELARKLLWYEPDHAQGLLVLGTALNYQKEYVASIPYLEQVTTESEFRSEAEVTLASSLLNAGFFRRCEQVLVDHLKTEPQDKQAQDILILLYKQTLRIPEAVQIYETRLLGTLADEITLRTVLDLLSGSVSTSAVAERLLASPRHQTEPDVLAAFGQIAVLEGDSEKAKSFFSKALTIAPADFRIVLWAAAFNLSSGQFDVAEDLLDRCGEDNVAAADQTPWIRSEYWRLRAMLADYHNEVSVALSQCELSLDALPQPETLSLKAGLLRKLKRSEEANAVAKQVAHLGHLDFELLKVGTEIRSKPVTIDLARQVSMILEGLGYPKQSASWAAIAEALSASGR